MYINPIEYILYTSPPSLPASWPLIIHPSIHRRLCSFRTHREIDQLLELAGLARRESTTSDRVIEQRDAQVLRVERVGRRAVVDEQRLLGTVGGRQFSSRIHATCRCTRVLNCTREVAIRDEELLIMFHVKHGDVSHMLQPPPSSDTNKASREISNRFSGESKAHSRLPPTYGLSPSRVDMEYRCFSSSESLSWLASRKCEIKTVTIEVM